MSRTAASRKTQAPQQKSILSKRQTGAVKVMCDGEDMTPEPMMQAGGAEGPRMRQASVDLGGAPGGAKIGSETSFQSLSQFHTQLYKQTLEAESVLRQSVLSVDDVVIEGDRNRSATLESGAVEEDYQAGGGGSAPPEDGGLTAPRAYPKSITLVLRETPTAFLIDLPSKTVERGSEEAPQVEADNELYEYLTVGKGRNRKMVNVEVQTGTVICKTRSTMAERIRRRHRESFAAVWDMYDTYKKPSARPPMAVYDEDDEDDKEDSREEMVELGDTYEGHEMAKLVRNERFLEAVCVAERLLANNNFNERQKRFRGLSDPDPFRQDIEYNYRLNLLWTFANKDTNGRCVTALCWNVENTDVLAVAYGKFYYTERVTGAVMVWNVKNPVQPERVYRFPQPVTAVSFSRSNPNLLAVGFYDGSVQVLDVSARFLRVIGYSSTDSPSFAPVWQIVWYRGSEYFRNEEQIIVTCEDGRVSYYRMQDTSELVYSQIMRIARPEGKLKGIETLKRCHVPGIPVSRYASALVIRQHPSDPSIYFVGTNEGTVHRCSRNYYYQHLDLYCAHQGPIYVIKFSPFCNRLYMTCGDDWQVRIWAEGIVEPLFELTKSMQSVQAADWSPTHSTIVASIAGSDVYVWDLQRKTYSPQSATTTPTNCRNTVVEFTPSGRCLVVGDVEGNVHVYALEDMPFPAFFQDDLLANSIFRGLVTRPDMVRKLKKLGKLSF